ncbi:MAG: VCBS repeat-containing protein [Actinobacteria bacterium]|nr:VCBS repeat-containing protein [Actinomycetota bacterium]
MRVKVARLARRALVLVAVFGLPALAVIAPSGWPSSANAAKASSSGFEGIRLRNVAGWVGLDLRQGAFRFGVSPDPAAMTGGGLCALDYNNDGWIDLFVVNSYSQADVDRWRKHGGLPRSALFRNRKGHFTNVSHHSRAGLAVRGEGCVAADFNRDGYTDLYVTTAGYDKLLWNNRDGTFTEGARAAGISRYGWHAGAAVGDVNGDGRPDLYVAGYTDPNVPVPGSAAGFPNNFAGVRDLLYLNIGHDRNGHSKFREVGVQAGLEAARFDHSLGAVFSDLDADGRLDLYVANDGDPNRLYQNLAWPGGRKADPAGLGFRFEERAAIAGVADPNAGMGVAAADFNSDGHTDLLVSNSRGQGHAVYTGQQPIASGSSFNDVHVAFTPAFGKTFTGWGASWVDLDLDGNLDLVLASGGIPVTNLARDAQPIQVLENMGAAAGAAPRFTDGTALVGGYDLPRVVGRGLTTADFDNNGRLDIAINTIGGKLELLRPTGAVGHWLAVRLAGFSPGAVVTAVLPDGRRLVREVQAGSSYLSSQDPRLHFGLGAATSVSQLIVRYPAGHVVERNNVPADRIVLFRRQTRDSTYARSTQRLAQTAPSLIGGCTRADLKGRSVARVWDEAMLDAIRRDLPAPTTHARNLFHVSAAMWDAWAAYDPQADGYFVTEKDKAPDVEAARETALSYAAYRVLLWRYAYGANVRVTFDELTRTMRSLCYRLDFTSTKGRSPAALGNRIAAAVIRAGRTDGSRERLHYADESYVPVNAPLVVKDPGTAMHDATFWQPLALDQTVAQNGLAVPGNVQTFIGAEWGHVRGFALPQSKRGVPIDPGPPPIGTPPDAAYKQAAVDVIRKSAALDAADGQVIDIGLDELGNNPLGTNDGHGYTVNPSTGQPYAPERVLQADYARVLAEFWADGPSSETPPGHWNVLANTVSNSPLLASRIGTGAANRLRWDVQMYFALNGAAHDAAIAAWGLKRKYQSVRPISMIRYLAEHGQSSDPELPSYDPAGLPLIPGLIELITKESSAPSQRHAALADHVGEIAIRAWRGNPKDPSQVSGAGWILGERWVPYQRATFVTPAFPGFVSGHSTFSRAAAEVLAAYTGSPYFPGGEFTQTFAPGYLKFERGPSKPLTLRWATYYDAADQAGISRIYGGIHIAADDLGGRRIGSTVGKRAFVLAERYFAGTVR